ncbi:MAG: hypothetical protein AB7G21_08925 [Dehalococcoidia bacterium]
MTSTGARRAASAPLLGNRALARLTAVDGAGLLAAHPAIAAHAGNRAVQRLVDPVQRDEKDGQPPAASTPQPISVTQMSHPNAGDVPGTAQQQQEREQRLTTIERALGEAEHPSGVADSTQHASMTGPEPSHAVNTVTDPTFRRGTTATDAAGLLLAGGTAVDIGMTAARLSGGFSGTTPKEFLEEMALGDLLPGVSLGLNVLGTAESAYRSQAAQDRGDAMSEGAARSRRADREDSAAGKQPTRGRAAEIFARGAAEQRDERDARATGAILGGTQAALTAAGIGLGPTPGGVAALASAGIFGVMKGGLAASRFVRKKMTSGNAAIHAQQVLFAAHNGDPAAIDTLKRLNVPTEDLDQPDVWQAAVAALSESMPRDEPRYRSGGSGVTGDSVVIDDRRPEGPSPYEGIGGGSLDEDGDDRHGVLTSTTNPLAANPQAQSNDNDNDNDNEAALPPSAAAYDGANQAEELPVVQRPRGRASAAIAAALQQSGGTPPAATTPNVTPDRTPMSEGLQLEELPDGFGQTFSTLPPAAFPFDPTGDK